MNKEPQPLKVTTHHDSINIFQRIGAFFQTRIWAQMFATMVVVAFIYILFHHYFPTPQDLWYDLRPTAKELTFESSDQMQFVNEKNGNFILWYEMRPDGYHFFDGPGFYGAGQARDCANTDEKIQKLKQWVDQNAKTKKLDDNQTLQLKQSQSNIIDLNAHIEQLSEANKALHDKVVSLQGDIDVLVQKNKELTGQTQSPNVSSATTQNAPADTSTNAPPVAVVEDPAFYQHGAIIPPNPKPLAWFQSLRWGKYPGKPYMFNRNTGFFEIPDRPETRIAPHPHFIARSNKTGQLERPFTIFEKINGQVPQEIQIPLLDDEYYRMTADHLGATFNSAYPYEVTAGGVQY